MGFLSKLAFWKKDDLSGLGNDNLNMGKDAFSNMDLGTPNNDFASQDNLGMNSQTDNMGLPPSRGMPDMTNYRGVGDPQEQNDINHTVREQLGPDPMADDSSGFSSYSPKPNYQEAHQGSPSSNHELQVISAKLDAVRATLDAVNQRLANLERVAYPSQDKTRRDSW